MSDGVPQIMRKCPHGEGKFVERLRVAEHPGDEITCPNIVREIAEEGLAEGVVTHILDGTSAVSVRVRDSQLFFSSSGESLQQDGADRAVPCQVNEFFE